ncbi:MAG: NERD domain-containing protein [Chloroflexi bacterium]|nr:NERD domain-containing protein [Chloroflexota bacterium]
MRFTTNEKLIARQSKIARYATFAGLAVLLASLVTSFAGNFPILVAYALLIVGFALAYVGAILAQKWVKEPRADNALARALKGFDNKFHLYNYLLPVNHVLLAPTGLIVFKVKSNDGKITVQGDRWLSPFRWTRMFGGMGQEPLGNPAADVRGDIEKMKKLLADKLEGAGVVPVDGYVVFTDPKAQLAIQDAGVPVVRVEDLKDTLRKSKRGPVLAPKLLEDLARVLDAEANAKAT